MDCLDNYLLPSAADFDCEKYRRDSWCTHPVTTITIAVLAADATTIGSHCALMTSKYSINDTAAGTKKKPILRIKKLDKPSTCRSFTSFSCSNIVRINIPMMLEGNFTPVSHTINSPSAKHPKIIAHCIIIAILYI